MKREPDIITICCIAIVVILFLCPLYFIKENQNLYFAYTPSKQSQEELRKATKDLENLKLNDLDSINQIIDIIRCNQIQVLKRQDNLISDFRQEMNNNVNKTNTWLAYAIGVIGVVGVFVPLVMQYKLRSNDKQVLTYELRKINLLKKELISQRNTTTSKVNHCLNKLSGQIIIKQKELDHNVSEQITRWEHDRKLEQLWSRFLSFTYGYEDRIVDNLSDRNSIIMYIWNSAICAFNDIIESCNKKKQLEEADRINLIISLIMLNSMVSKIRNSKDIAVYRYLDSISDKLRVSIDNLIKSVPNHTVIQQVISDLQVLIKQLKEISLPDLTHN